MKIEVSNGELLDKYTILQIKCERITDTDKLAHAEHERQALMIHAQQLIGEYPTVIPMIDELKQVNMKLWDIEDRLREFEDRREFTREFAEWARLVYMTNDKRAQIKRKINAHTKSEFHEVKSYAHANDTEIYGKILFMLPEDDGA